MAYHARAPSTPPPLVAAPAPRNTVRVVALGDRIEVVIDSPRLSFIKRRDDGSVDFVSPLPTPYNYGSVPGTVAADGDRLDAMVLGPTLPRGAAVHTQVRGVVHFVDAGVEDLKLICSAAPLTHADLAGVRAFFVVYARAKRVLNALRGAAGPTHFVRVDS